MLIQLQAYKQDTITRESIFCVAFLKRTFRGHIIVF